MNSHPSHSGMWFHLISMTAGPSLVTSGAQPLSLPFPSALGPALVRQPTLLSSLPLPPVGFSKSRLCSSRALWFGHLDPVYPCGSYSSLAPLYFLLSRGRLNACSPSSSAFCHVAGTLGQWGWTPSGMWPCALEDLFPLWGLFMDPFPWYTGNHVVLPDLLR